MRKFFFNENNMMIAIGINAIVIFCLSFPELSQSLFWIILDDIFIAFFLVEAVIKIKALKFKNYWKDKWNKFDFIVAVGSLPLLFPKLLELMAAQGIDPFIIVMLRLFRLLRLVKFFWFVPNLAHLLRGLSRAFKASIFVLIILLFFNFILSIAFCRTNAFSSLIQLVVEEETRPECSALASRRLSLSSRQDAVHSATILKIDSFSLLLT